MINARTGVPTLMKYKDLKGISSISKGKRNQVIGT